MAMNSLEKILADAREQGGMDELVAALEAKKSELGEDPSEEACDQAVKSVLDSLLHDFFGEAIDDDDTDSSEFMETSVNTVKEALDSQGWHYSSRDVRADITIFEMGFNVNKVSLRITIYVEDSPKNCRIKATLPFNGDSVYVYPLCRALAVANYPKRYGAFQYDEDNGELSYEYSYPITHGLYKDDFLRLIRAVMHSAVDEDVYPEIKKSATGKFKNKEKNEILSKVNDLVNDLTE